jgi:hypothetical protein
MNLADLSLDELQSLLEQAIAKHHEPRIRYAEKLAEQSNKDQK